MQGINKHNPRILVLSKLKSKQKLVSQEPKHLDKWELTEPELLILEMEATAEVWVSIQQQ